ncbi:MAG: signal peptidase I [Oscillospiraceae bacterium]|jgi:signal peptidase I|nr:signal peptidase I [Oscillospiraceae bacterium]
MEQQDVKVKQDISAVIYDYLKMVVVIVVCCLLVFVFVVRKTAVEGTSMLDTLHHNDQLIVSNLLYEPKRGDIAVLTHTEYMTKPMVKRVIAVGGDTVDIDYEAGYVILNGTPLDEPYIREPMFPRISGVEFPLTIPEGYIFVLGDNRNGSSDGRVYGPVDKREVVGKVYAVIKIGKFLQDAHNDAE